MLNFDPDLIMVREMRDKETAEVAIRAAFTGHPVIIVGPQIELIIRINSFSGDRHNS
jgi:Tfp pilus assembly ATPase PilU